MIPRLARVSLCSSSPDSTHVTISMSRWGWVENPVPGAMQSSLFTSSNPWPVFVGSQCPPKLKLWCESSHEIWVCGRVSALRTSIMPPSMLFGTKLFRADLGQELRQGRHLPIAERAEHAPLCGPMVRQEVLQQATTLGGQLDEQAATVLRMTAPGDEPALLERVDHPRHRPPCHQAARADL